MRMTAPKRKRHRIEGKKNYKLDLKKLYFKQKTVQTIRYQKVFAVYAMCTRTFHTDTKQKSLLLLLLFGY